MGYKEYSTIGFFRTVRNEKRARDLVWRSKFGGKDFVCPHCQHEAYYQYKSEPEIRKCRGCHAQVRLRVGTALENSKSKVLTWVRAIFFVMDSKRGISAKELQRKLKVSYQTAWSLLKKIRSCLQRRDERYKLKEMIELDGAVFGKKHTGNQSTVLVAIESKDWVDEKGREKSKAGFVKVGSAPEKQVEVQDFVDKNITPGSMVNTDGGSAMLEIANVDHDYQVVGRDQAVIDRWLPWVHKFVSNAKAWILGTHHGVSTKYLGLYLAEYAYRFNRRHDPGTLFHRALTACARL